LQSAYRTSPFFEYYEDDLEPLFKDAATGLLAHNLKIFELLSELIGIEAEISKTQTYEAHPDIPDLRFLVNAKRYSSFDAEPYIQVLEVNHGFLPNLSVLDLLFNEGPNTLGYLEKTSLSHLELPLEENQ